MARNPKAMRRQFQVLLKIYARNRHFSPRQVKIALKQMKGIPGPTQFYVLNKRQHYPVRFLHWALWYEHGKGRIIKRTPIKGDIIVSTVFLALDSSFGMASEPVLYETMVFGGGKSLFQQRYASIENALKGHERAVQDAKTSV